jgi:DNA-binding transcriptional ArsR family regulator
MRNITPLDALLPKTRQGILSTLFRRSDRSWYASELAKHLGVPSSSLQRELRDLTEAGILKASRQGRMAFFQVDTESPIFTDLHNLFLKTTGLVDVLKKPLLRLAPPPRIAFIFGSIAAGTERSQSDIDLMLIGSVSPIDLAGALRKSQGVLGREIQPFVFSPEELRQRLKNRDHFLTQVMDKPKLFVIGNAHELAEVTGRR